MLGLLTVFIIMVFWLWLVWPEFHLYVGRDIYTGRYYEVLFMWDLRRDARPGEWQFRHEFRLTVI